MWKSSGQATQHSELVCNVAVAPSIPSGVSPDLIKHSHDVITLNYFSLAVSSPYSFTLLMKRFIRDRQRTRFLSTPRYPVY